MFSHTNEKISPRPSELYSWTEVYLKNWTKYVLVQWATKFITPPSIRNTWKQQGPWLLWPTVMSLLYFQIQNRYELPRTGVPFLLWSQLFRRDFRRRVMTEMTKCQAKGRGCHARFNKAPFPVQIILLIWKKRSTRRRLGWFFRSEEIPERVTYAWLRGWSMCPKVRKVAIIFS